MIKSPTHPTPVRPLTLIALTALTLFLGACTTTAPAPTPATDHTPPRQQEQANALLRKAQQLYDEGSYTEAMQNFLMAAESGLLGEPQQLQARKHLAFIHCVSSRVPLCAEQFQKAFAVSEKFDLSPAEAGHPVWGPVFRNVKADVEKARGGKATAPAAAPGDKAFASAMAAYEAGDYGRAIAGFKDLLKDNPSLERQIASHKFLAFSYCLTRRTAQCRAEFVRVLQLNPHFELSATEAGHPSWGPTFRAEKARKKAAPAGK